MVVANHCRVQKQTVGLRRLLGHMMLFAPAAATATLLTGALEAANPSSSQEDASSIAAPHGDTLPLHPYTTLNLVLGQSLGAFESAIVGKQQKHPQMSQRLVVSAGLVAVALALAFLVLQCTRTARFPRLFSSVTKRALSDSDLEDQRVDTCVGEQREAGGDGARYAGEGKEGNTSEEAGELAALQTLEDLRCIVTLGVQTVPYLPFDRNAFLVALVVTICTQELVLYGIYSTPQVEVERQKTMDFILEEARLALAQLDAGGQLSDAAVRAERILELLEEFRTPRPEQNALELAVEASISACRVLPCKEALLQLQPWVKNSTPIPEEVDKRFRRVLTYTRLAGKGRLKADAKAYSWVMMAQTQVGFNVLFESHPEDKFFIHRLSFETEMRKRRPRYKKLARLLASSVEFALSQKPMERHLKEQHQQEQRRREELQQLQPRQHHWTNQVAASISRPGFVRQPVMQPVTLRTRVGVQPFYPSRPLLAPSHGTVTTETSSLTDSPLFQTAQLPSNDSDEHLPTARREHGRHSSTPSAPRWGKTQRETKDQQQSSHAYFTAKGVLRAEAPVFTPREPVQAYAQEHAPPTASGARNLRRLVPPSPALAPLWLPVDPSTTLQSGFPLAHESHMPTQSHVSYPEMIPPVTTIAPHSRAPHHRTPWAPQPLRGQSFTVRQPFQPSERPSGRFLRPALQSPTSATPLRASTPPNQLSAAWGHIPVSRFEAPTAFWPPQGGETQGSIFSDSSEETASLNPLLDLIAEAFPTTETPVSGETEQRRYRPKDSPRAPPPHAPLSGGSWKIFAKVLQDIPVPRRSQGASPAPEETPQTSESATWSLHE
ncbi:uncharacterized protein EMH_0061610 [Eimeria mitis]|uniref:Transmembrane protein n=1 Tax=Eimeria mitis TaxID=44415 RepID=U6KKV0_9EIME|nr:uncharacterized protein EMH_0061610 [Eimeria mitis]CDJ36088.1 hypothetical protein, conserved [Eimeria mitis]